MYPHIYRNRNDVTKLQGIRIVYTLTSMNVHLFRQNFILYYFRLQDMQNVTFLAIQSKKIWKVTGKSDTFEILPKIFFTLSERAR
jgi:hypothetical protein